MYNTLTVLPAWHVLLWPFYQHDVYYSHSFTSMMCTSGSFTSMACTTLTVYQHDMHHSNSLLPWHVLLWQFYQHDVYYSDSFNSMMCTTLSFPAWHVLLLTVLPAWCVLLCQFYQHDNWHVLFWQFYQHGMHYSDSNPVTDLCQSFELFIAL